MSKLVIVESPSKAKTIEKYLGADYHVISSKGHIRDLATNGHEGLGIDIRNNFKPTYIDITNDKKPNAAAVIKELGREIKKADQVYLATDPDREGEAIAWHIADRFNLPLDQKNRIVFSEITKPVVTAAIANPKQIDMKMVDSQETRRMYDRIIGFKLSTLLQRRINSKSAGRVQSVALKLIVDREKEIAAFVSEEYWTVDATFTKDGSEFTANLAKISGRKAEIKNGEKAEEIRRFCSGNPFTITDIKDEVKQKAPRPPYITSTLQQDAINKLGFSASKTMRIAQTLYEGKDVGNGLTGLITYMRTDSVRMSEVFMAQARQYIIDNYGKAYTGYYRGKTAANAQDAHEAIRPTDINNDPEKIKSYLTNDEYKLYRMIYYRALAAMMKNSKYQSLTVKLENGKYEFTANGRKQLFDGYLKVYGQYETSDEKYLPALEINEVINSEHVDSRQHFTEPPLRYSEARLIKTMEDLGIGRPSTYASTLGTIMERDYVTLRAPKGSKTKVFTPTKRGILTSDKLDEFFSTIINTKYTADMEKQLDDIAEGKEDHIKAVRDFYNTFEPLVQNAYVNMKRPEPEKTGDKCPLCGGDLVIRTGSWGEFIGCANYPRCNYTKNITQETGEMCPECGAPLVKKTNSKGQSFIGCSNYPNCRFTKQDPSAPRRYYRRKRNYGKSS